VRLKFWRREKSGRDYPGRADVEEIANRIRVIRLRLSKRLREMDLRYREIFEQVVKAHMEKDPEKAALYAQELAELRKILRKLTRADVLLEGTAYRLEAVKELSDVGSLIMPVKNILTDISNELSGVAPATSEGIRDLISSIEEFSIKVGYVPESGSISTELSAEAKKILDEASSIAAHKREKKGEIKNDY